MRRGLDDGQDIAATSVLSSLRRSRLKRVDRVRQNACRDHLCESQPSPRCCYPLILNLAITSATNESVSRCFLVYGPMHGGSTFGQQGFDGLVAFKVVLDNYVSEAGVEPLRIAGVGF